MDIKARTSAHLSITSLEERSDEPLADSKGHPAGGASGNAEKSDRGQGPMAQGHNEQNVNSAKAYDHSEPALEVRSFEMGERGVAFAMGSFSCAVSVGRRPINGFPFPLLSHPLEGTSYEGEYNSIPGGKEDLIVDHRYSSPAVISVRRLSCGCMALRGMR
jgi:hypothetical protein